MSTCRWCMTDDSGRTSLLKSYATKSLPADELDAANEDLCYCLECVDGYHKARDEVPSLHEALWELETTRLILHFKKTMAGAGEDDDLFIVEEDGETVLPCYTGPLNFEKDLRVPLLEILKYPYLLLDKPLSELCVSALCEMEKNNYPYQVMDKHPGIYLLMVHPNEVIRRWAILTARNLGKVDRDDYYDIQEVLTCLFKVIELGLFESPDIYSSSVIEKGKLVLLPSHLYDTSNYKNYWLGICMLLTVLEEQAMDSLLLGSDKQINFVQSIMSVMEKPAEDQSKDPFWPALHCFMVILDKLGSKVWGQPIDPVEAFQNIINNPSYKNEIKSIRESCTGTKSEPVSNYGDDMMTCSQIVYDYQTEKPQKDIGWKSAICPDYCPNLYEDMQTVADMLQYEVGQDMRLHNSTFLWFIPFVHSIMDLREGVAYNGEVIHHLCSEIKEAHSLAFPYFDRVSEFFMWILVSVVELHHNKNSLHLLWITSSKWLEAVVNCAALPSGEFLRGAQRSAWNPPRATATALSQGCSSIQSACMKLIRSLLKEGYQQGQKVACEPLLNRLNVIVRCGVSHQEDCLLTVQERRDLQACLKQVVRSIKDKRTQSAASGEGTGLCVASPTHSTKQDKGMPENRCPVTTCCEHPSALRGNVQEGMLPRSNGLGEMCKEASCRVQLCRSLCRTSVCLLTKIKQEPEDSSTQESKNLNCSNEQRDAQQNGHPAQGDQSKPTASHACSDQGVHNLKAREVSKKEERLGPSPCPPVPERNQNDRNGPEINSNQIKLEKPHLLLKLRQLSEKLKQKSFTLKPAGEKQEPVKSGSGGQKGGDSGASRSPSDVLQHKAGESSAGTVQMDPLSTGRPAGPGSTLTGDHDLHESDEDHMPFTMILQKLRVKGSASAASPMTDSQVDRDLSKLSLTTYASIINFPVDSSQENTIPCQSSITRKVQGVTRSLSVDQLPDTGKPTEQVITISDSEEGENKEPMKGKAGVCLEKQSGVAQEQALLSTSSSPLPYEECASQIFEFETEEDIYSAWQDSQLEEKMEKPCPSVKTSSCSTSVDFEAIQQINDWGYDTDYLGDEVTEKAAETLEQQVKCSKAERQQVRTSKGSEAGRKHGTSLSKGTVASRSELATRVHAKDREHPGGKDLVRPCTSASSVKESPPGKHSPKFQEVEAAQSPKKSILKPSASHSKWLQAKPFRSDPTEAPPKEDHHCQQSTAEKLGQKKTSQNALGHSLDSVAKWRGCGETASESRLPAKKAKLIPAQNLVVRNRKMLACQERPVQQQSTVEKLGLKKAPRKALELSQRSLDNVAQLRNHGKAVGDLGLPQQKASKAGKNRKLFAHQGRPSRRSGSRESKEEQAAHRAAKIARKAQLKQCLQSRTKVAENQKVGPEQGSTSLSCEKNQLRQSSLEKEGFQLPPEPPLARRDSTEANIQGSSAALPGTSCSSATDARKGDSVDVTMSPSSPCDEGADPNESMSKLNENMEEDDGLFLTQRDTVDMELCSQEENDIEMEVNVPQGPLQAHSEICSHAGCSEKVSNAGASCKEHSTPDPSNHVFAKPSAPARPPTAKLFSSSSSRNANLAKDLENNSKAPVARNASAPPASKGEGFRSQTPTFSSILRPQNSNPVPQPRSMQNNCFAAVIPRRAAVLGVYAGQEVRQPPPQPHSASTQQRDFKMFIKAVLKWEYSMFADFSRFGAPDDLRQSIVGPVPLRFQDYNDYFNTFFPLMMLNAFETVAQDWLETQRSKEKSFTLSLVSCSADVGSANFTVDIPESDLAAQRHPKEDDLVFLTVSEKRSPSCEEKENCDVRYVGLVTQFKSGNPTKKKVVCHLAIQTQGNLFRASKQVKCVVVSSLLTTQRRFRALLLFRRSPLYKPIVSPSYGYFRPRYLNADTKNMVSGDFNEDQRRAIETAYAMVTQEPSVPSICLIHGPPGTGKSKTILGLLDRILNDSSRAENPAQRPHARRKQNRVLVCAPSNAAVDELMKKIILVFKEKCPDKEKCLGNCGDINLVRLGQEKSIHKDVRHFSLYDLVERRINRKKAGEDQGCPKEKKAELDHQLDMLSRQRAMDRSEDKEKRQRLEEEICRLAKKRQQLASQLKQVHRHSQELKSTIILESNIICCTLSMSGLSLLESTFRRQGYDPFSCVIVDEAGQSCEVETLIPLIHGCKKLVLVGDPKQLPPTVKSRKAQDNGYDQSLMGRLCRHLEEQNWGDKLILQLTIQYRMHPDLCIFPSKYIYSGKLVTAEARVRMLGKT
ncbi:probable helicase senataxin isoform X2 [Tiliqua scincoides]|uniref:probable helicase senataxin isoform X2 n=1 Tax=Tiliqua scincoides TaxID=71010 RepID=UPI00346184D3